MFVRNGVTIIANVPPASDGFFEAKLVVTGSGFAEEFRSERDAKAAAIDLTNRLLDWAV